jgi:hypothetical protein
MWTYGSEDGVAHADEISSAGNDISGTDRDVGADPPVVACLEDLKVAGGERVLGSREMPVTVKVEVGELYTIVWFQDG